MLDNVTITGDLHIALYNEYGVIKDRRNIRNMVVASGRNIIANLIGGSSVKPTHIGLGNGNVPASNEQTSLVSESTSRIIFNTVNVSDNITTFTATLNPGTGTGSYAEAGIFTASTVGEMLARTTFNTITKTPVDKLVITWNIRVS